MTFFTKLEQIILKFIWNHRKKTQIAKAILRKKNKAKRISLPDFLLCYKSTVIKTTWYWHKKQTYRLLEQNRELRNKPIYLWSINLQQKGKNIQWRKLSLFNNWYWENWTATCQTMRLEHFFTPYTRKKQNKKIKTTQNGLKT